MGRFFDMDSPAMRFLNRVGDLMILNFLMILCCIPVVTAGAACTGMHYVLLKIARGEEGYLVRGFFKSFVQNFRQATILWLIMLLVIAIYVGDFAILNYSELQFPRIVTILIIAVAIVFLMVSVYIFPILARFDNTIKNTIKNAFIMTVLNLPKTLLMVLVYCLPVAVVWIWSYATIFVIMFGISLPAYLSARIYSGIFKKYEPEKATQASDYEFSIREEEGNEEDNE